MTLVYILSGILLLSALSYLGIRREKQERLRFEREDLARIEGATTHELHFRSRFGVNPLVLSLDQKGGSPSWDW